MLFDCGELTEVSFCAIEADEPERQQSGFNQVRKSRAGVWGGEFLWVRFEGVCGKNMPNLTSAPFDALHFPLPLFTYLLIVNMTCGIVEVIQVLARVRRPFCTLGSHE
jgi:hypothetical protein